VKRHDRIKDGRNDQENSNPDAESLGPLISERGKQYRRCRHHCAQNRQLLDVVLSDAAKVLFLVATEGGIKPQLPQPAAAREFCPGGEPAPVTLCS